MNWKYEVNIDTPKDVRTASKLVSWVSRATREECGVNGMYAHVVAALDRETVLNENFDFKFWFMDRRIADEFKHFFGGEVKEL